MKPIVLVHGGACNVDPNRVEGKLNGVKAAALEGYRVLENGGTAVDAVEAAVSLMEDDEYFNAGYGSVLNISGLVEMDASIMRGLDLQAGAVTLITNVKNPVSLARRVMEHSPHVLLTGSGAEILAQQHDIPLISPDSMVSDYARDILKSFIDSGCKPEFIGEMGGTCGAVALDSFGHVAAATSTGGTNGKMPGRIGDTPQIGSGTYADDNIGAASSTGNGETIIKFCLAHCLIKEIEKGVSVSQASQQCIDDMTRRLKNTGGIIAVSKSGEPGIAFSTSKMSWAYRQADELHYGINPGQHEINLVR